MARATSSLPVPVSPSSNTVEFPVATVSTSRNTFRSAALCPYDSLEGRLVGEGLV